MITVLVREENETEGQLLGEFEPSEIQEVIDLFDQHDTYFRTTGNECSTSDTLYFQFVVDKKRLSSMGYGVFFEIILST